MLGVPPQVKVHKPPQTRKREKNITRETRKTQISYIIVHGRKLTHTSVHAKTTFKKKKKNGGPEIWLQLCWRCQSVSKVKKKKKQHHEKHLFFGTSIAKECVWG